MKQLLDKKELPELIVQTGRTKIIATYVSVPMERSSSVVHRIERVFGTCKLVFRSIFFQVNTGILCQMEAGFAPSLAAICTFRPDNRTIALAGYGGKLIRFFGLPTGQKLGELKGHTDRINVLPLRADRQRLATMEVFDF